MTLKEWLDANKELTREEFGALVGVSRGTVQRWLSGAIKPEPAAMALVWRETGGAVEPNDWFPEIL